MGFRAYHRVTCPLNQLSCPLCMALVPIMDLTVHLASQHGLVPQEQTIINQSIIHQTFDSSINQSYSPSINQSYSLSIIQSYSPPINQYYSPSIDQSYSLSIIQSYSPSINQKNYQSTNKSYN